MKPHKTWTLVIAGMATFMTALDTLVVTTALPVLRADLRASLSGLEWTVNAYNLVWVAVGFSALGAVAAALTGGRRELTADAVVGMVPA